MLKLLFNEELYQQVIEKALVGARKSIWIATADIKDLYIVKGRRNAAPLLDTLAGKLTDGVAVELLHAKEPGQRFQKDFDRHQVFLKSPVFQRWLCPRVHFKTIIIDEKLAYSGSANLTGAGLGAKAKQNRNFENGLWTDEPALVKQITAQYRMVTRGRGCHGCGRQSYCPDPIDLNALS